MKRRDFLLMTGAAAGAAVMDPFERDAPGPPEWTPEVKPGVETFVPTTCRMCPGACGLKVRRVDGSPVGIVGNPNHPINAGGVCTEGISSLQLLYHPDRLLRPMKRNGSRDLETVTWQDALDTIVQALRRLREKGRPGNVAFVLGRTGTTMQALVQRFMSSWGSPNLFLDEPRDGWAEVFEAMHGLPARPAFDMENTGLVLSLGADFMDAWESPLQFERAYSLFRDPARVHVGSMIVADTRLTRTASRAKEWIAVRPGSFGALALGIAYVMLRERLYDQSFVENHLYGFEDFTDRDGRTHRGYRSLVLQEYSPEAVSRWTGVAVERILSLGKSFGETPAALAVFDESVVSQPGGLYAGMAVHSLNLLKGNLNRPGGIYLQPDLPLAPLSSPSQQDGAGRRPRFVEDLGETGDLPEVVFLYYSNPLYSSPFKRALEERLSKVALVVSFSPFLDETGRLADLLLPDSLFLERWDDRSFPLSSPIPGWGIVQPCVPPAGETRAAGDVLLELAGKLGSPVKEALPWESFEELLKERARGLYDSRSGTLCVDLYDQGLVAEMERRGWWVPSSESFEDFWQNLLETGAWTDPNYQVRTLEDYSGNPDFRVDLYSRWLARRLSELKTPFTDGDCLPRHAEGAPQGRDTQFPMVLNPFRPGKLCGGTSAILPWILERSGGLQNLAWDSWAEIHPEDAAMLRIEDRDWVWVESAAGRLRVRAVIYAGVARGVVGIPCGLGHQEMGRWARDRGVNPLDLLMGNREPVSGLVDRYATGVKVYKA